MRTRASSRSSITSTPHPTMTDAAATVVGAVVVAMEAVCGKDVNGGATTALLITLPYVAAFVAS